MTIKAIETRYAGCHFRSRLEARWAVAMDHLGVRWEYEPQGYTVSNRLRLPGLPETWNYLPDFWLPDLELWVEVKGALTDHEYLRLLSAAASLSSNDGDGCHGSGGHDLLLLGPIPTPDRRAPVPTRLHMHKGILIRSGWGCGQWTEDEHGWHSEVASDSSDVLVDAQELLAGWPTKCGDKIRNAYAAARMARFEHGQTPRPTHPMPYDPDPFAGLIPAKQQAPAWTRRPIQ